MKAATIKENTLAIANTVYYLLEDGSCPICNCRIRIEQPDGIVYKIRLFKIFRSGLKQVKCPECKSLLRER